MAVPRACNCLNHVELLCKQDGQGRPRGKLQPMHVACAMDRQGGTARGINATRRHAKPQTANQEIVTPLPSEHEAEKVLTRS